MDANRSELVAQGFEAMAGLVSEVKASVAKSEAMEPIIKTLEEQIDFLNNFVKNLEQTIFATAAQCNAQSGMMQQLEATVRATDQKLDKLDAQVVVMSTTVQHLLQKPETTEEPLSNHATLTDKPSLSYTSMQEQPASSPSVPDSLTSSATSSLVPPAEKPNPITAGRQLLGPVRAASSPPSSNASNSSSSRRGSGKPKRAQTLVARLPRLTSGEPWSGAPLNDQVVTNETISQLRESLKAQSSQASIKSQSSLVGSDPGVQSLFLKMDRLETQMEKMCSSLDRLDKPASHASRNAGTPLLSHVSLQSVSSSSLGTEQSIRGSAVARTLSAGRQVSQTSLGSSKVPVGTIMAKTLGAFRASSSPPRIQASPPRIQALLPSPRVSMKQESSAEAKQGCTQVTSLPRLTSGEPWNGDASDVQILTALPQNQSLKTQYTTPQPVVSSTPPIHTPSSGDGTGSAQIQGDGTFRRSNSVVSNGFANTMVGPQIPPQMSPTLEKSSSTVPLNRSSFNLSPRHVPGRAVGSTSPAQNVRTPRSTPVAQAKPLTSAVATTSPAMVERVRTPRLAPRAQAMPLASTHTSTPHLSPRAHAMPFNGSLSVPVGKLRST